MHTLNPIKTGATALIAAAMAWTPLAKAEIVRAIAIANFQAQPAYVTACERANSWSNPYGAYVPGGRYGNDGREWTYEYDRHTGQFRQTAIQGAAVGTPTQQPGQWFPPINQPATPRCWLEPDPTQANRPPYIVRYLYRGRYYDLPSWNWVAPGTPQNINL